MTEPVKKEPEKKTEDWIYGDDDFSEPMLPPGSDDMREGMATYFFYCQKGWIKSSLPQMRKKHIWNGPYMSVKHNEGFY